MVLWTEQFATGVDRIDQQHRTLINNINHLESMLTDTNPSRAECEFLIHLVDFLESYADTHFQFEEHCMHRYRCPVHARNRQAHECFLNFLQEFKERCKKEGFRLDVLRKLHETLSGWIQEHILQVDTQLKPSLKG